MFTSISKKLKPLIEEESRIPALDGLRTLAILLVVVTHCAAAFVAWGGSPSWLTRTPLVRGGWMGVDLFFVLSGFLIGSQLVRELGTRGTVGVGRFVLRRGLRIWPLYFVVLGVSISIRALSTGFAPRTYWPEAVFLGNYFDLGADLIPGSWSLAVEEQFYLVAPVAFALLARFWPGFPKRVAWIPTVAFLAAPAIRAAVWLPLVRSGSGDLAHELAHLYTPFHTHYDGLAMGLWIAACPPSSVREGSARWLGSASVLGTAIAAIALWRLDRPIFTYWALAWVFGALVRDCLSDPSGTIARLFSWKAFRISSRLSYGIYLWYRFVLSAFGGFARRIFAWAPPSLQMALHSAIIFLAAGAIALVTYVLVEQPFIRWRNRLLAAQYARPGRKI